MTMYSQYIYSLMLFTVKNNHLFTPNSKIHEHRKRCSNDLHFPIANLKRYTEGPYFSAIKIYNHLPEFVKSLASDLKKFKKNPEEVLVSTRFLLYSRI